MKKTLTNVYLYQQNILYNRPKFFAIAFVLLSLQLKYIPLAVKTQCYEEIEILYKWKSNSITYCIQSQHLLDHWKYYHIDRTTICFSGQTVRENQTLFISHNPPIYAFLIFFYPFFFYISLDRQHITQRSEDEDYRGGKTPSYTSNVIALETNKIFVKPIYFSLI